MNVTANVTDDVLVKIVLVEINGTNYTMNSVKTNGTLLSAIIPINAYSIIPAKLIDFLLIYLWGFSKYI